jgi:hypothetical protein
MPTNGFNRTTGRFDASQTPVMKRIRKPKFVDNAVSHAEITKAQSGFVVKAPTQADFVPSHDRRYTIVEEEEAVRLTHKTSDGHRYVKEVFFSDEKVGPSSPLPPLIVNSDKTNQSLVPSKIENVDKGVRFRLENMKGRDLNGVGFTGKDVHLAQKANVGLRSSDLATRIARATPSSLNGVEVRRPSNSFIAQDFYGIAADAALRFVSRHDGYSVRGDRFGNLLYSHQHQFNREHVVTSNTVMGGSIKDKTENIPNRIVVRGRNRANNDNNVVQIDDHGNQSSGVIEIPGGISAPTAITKAAARRVGQRFLASAKRVTSGEILKEVVHVSTIYPGDVVSYRTPDSDQRQIVLHAKHDLVQKHSELHINATSSNLEDVIQRFQEVDIGNTSSDNDEKNRQTKHEDFATGAGYKLKVTWQIGVRKSLNSGVGMLIGHYRRSTINGRADIAESRNAHLKIGTSLLTFETSRRG